MPLRRCRAIPLLTGICALMLCAGCGNPTITVDGETTTYHITVAKHRNAPGSLNSETIRTTIEDGEKRWTENLVAGSADTSDFTAKVNFVLEGEVKNEFTTTDDKFHQDKYRIIADEATLGEILKHGTAVSEWALLITAPPPGKDDDQWGGRAAQPGRRFVLGAKIWYHGGMWAHELGHNAGLPDRAESNSDGIMVSDNGSDDGTRVRASKAEAKAMQSPK